MNIKQICLRLNLDKPLNRYSPRSRKQLKRLCPVFDGIVQAYTVTAPPEHPPEASETPDEEQILEVIDLDYIKNIGF